MCGPYEICVFGMYVYIRGTNWIDLYTIVCVCTYNAHVRVRVYVCVRVRQRERERMKQGTD